MSEIKTFTFMSGWSKAEQDFASIITEIVTRKYKKYMREHKEKENKPILLADIKIELEVLKNDYVNYMQGIAPSEKPENTAKGMLYIFCIKEEIEKCYDGVYKLNKSGVLYKHLAKNLQ